MNIAIIVGNLAQDPEIKQTGDKYLVTLRVATSEGKLATEYHTVKMFTKYVAKFKDYQKGDLIMVDGSVQNRSYEQGGNKRWVTEINAKKISRLNSTHKTEEW